MSRVRQLNAKILNKPSFFLEKRDFRAQRSTFYKENVLSIKPQIIVS